MSVGFIFSLLSFTLLIGSTEFLLYEIHFSLSMKSMFNNSFDESGSLLPVVAPIVFLVFVMFVFVVCIIESYKLNNSVAKMFGSFAASLDKANFHGVRREKMEKIAKKRLSVPARINDIQRGIRFDLEPCNRSLANKRSKFIYRNPNGIRHII